MQPLLDRGGGGMSQPSSPHHTADVSTFRHQVHGCRHQTLSLEILHRRSSMQSGFENPSPSARAFVHVVRRTPTDREAHGR